MRRNARGTTILKKYSSLQLYAIVGLAWIGLLACRVTDVIAQVGATVTPTATRPRPTFTLSARLIEIPTDIPPPSSTRPPSPTPRPPTRIPTATKPAPTLPPPPTPDPYAGYYYKPVNKGCVTAPNTRIQGTVIENGSKKNGVKVRVGLFEGGDPVIDDFITGIDPSDYKHIDPSLQGQYRLGLFEGQQNAGNWWVFILDDGGSRISPGVYVITQDGGGCTTATIDFVH